MPITKPILMGGLMRCCIKFLEAEYTGTEDDGDVVKCPYCKFELHVHDGHWQWNWRAKWIEQKEKK